MDPPWIRDINMNIVRENKDNGNYMHINIIAKYTIITPVQIGNTIKSYDIIDMNRQGRIYWYRVIFLQYNEIEVTVVLPF